MLKAIIKPTLNDRRISIFNGGFLPEECTSCIFDVELFDDEDEWNARITTVDGTSFQVCSADLYFFNNPEEFFDAIILIHGFQRESDLWSYSSKLTVG